MIRRLVPIFFALAVVGAFGWTLMFLYERSKAAPVAVELVSAQTRDIVRKTVAAGAIVPRREVAIKPRVSGILQHLFVKAGQQVKQGDPVAEIKIVPNVVALNSAESRLDAARINARNREKEFNRVDRLYSQMLLPEAERNRALLEVELARQEVMAATNNLQLVKEGAIRGSGKVSNVVRSTVAGMVIEVPVEEGVSVTETNNFNEGTTIAAVADMRDMIFRGFVDESEVGKLKAAMPVSIAIGALPKEKFTGTLEYIAPKGTDNEGTIEFEVIAALDIPEGSFVRANYSANADIILDQRAQVLSLNERVLQFEDSQPFVEVEVAPGQYERRNLKLGLSDGIVVEVLEGLDASDSVRVPQTVAQTTKG